MRPVRYFFTSAARGTSALFRLCIDAMEPQWTEETSPEVQRTADQRFLHDEKQPRCIVWVDKVSGRHTFRPTEIALGIQSRLDGMKDVANKSDTERALALCRDLGLHGFGLGGRSYFPRTWLLPEQRAEFEAHVRQSRLEVCKHSIPTYIVKPAGGSEGMGIFLLRHEHKVPRYKVATTPLVAQDYIAPMLLDGKKFDLRLYVLIRSVDPLEAYVHREGLARFCTADYAAPSDDNLEHSFAHLTNFSLNKNSDAFVGLSQSDMARRRRQAPTEDADDTYAGCSKRPVSRVLEELHTLGKVDVRRLWQHIERLVALTVLALQPHLALRYRDRFPRVRPFGTVAEAAAANSSSGGGGGGGSSNSSSNSSSTTTEASRRDLQPRRGLADRSHSAFHVVGFDVLLDEAGCPHLLEVNSKPSLGIEQESEHGGREHSPIDVQVKQLVMGDMLRHVASQGNSPLLRLVVGEAKQRPPPQSVGLLDRLRRVFDVLTHKPSPAAGAAPATTGAAPFPGSISGYAAAPAAAGAARPVAALAAASDRELSISKFTQFARASGLHELVASTDVPLAFVRFAQRQAEETRGVASCQIVGGGGSPRSAARTAAGGVVASSAASLRPRHESIRFPAFARALGALADAGLAELCCEPLPRGMSARAARLEQLLDFISTYTPPLPALRKALAPPWPSSPTSSTFVGSRLERSATICAAVAAAAATSSPRPNPSPRPQSSPPRKTAVELVLKPRVPSRYVGTPGSAADRTQVGAPSKAAQHRSATSRPISRSAVPSASRAPAAPSSYPWERAYFDCHVKRPRTATLTPYSAAPFEAAQRYVPTGQHEQASLAEQVEAAFGRTFAGSPISSISRRRR